MKEKIYILTINNSQEFNIDALLGQYEVKENKIAEDAYLDAKNYLDDNYFGDTPLFVLKTYGDLLVIKDEIKELIIENKKLL